MSDATAPLTVYVNDQPRSVATGLTLFALARELGLADRKGVAIAVNGAVAPRVSWPERSLTSDDRILVINATQGG